MGPVERAVLTQVLGDSRPHKRKAQLRCETCSVSFNSQVRTTIGWCSFPQSDFDLVFTLAFNPQLKNDRGNVLNDKDSENKYVSFQKPKNEDH